MRVVAAALLSSRSKRAAESVALAESQVEWGLRFWRALGSDEVSHGASCAVATVSYHFFVGHAGRRRSHESAGTRIFNAHIRNDGTSWNRARRRGFAAIEFAGRNGAPSM
jgi:hypothetical protein